VSFNDIYTNIIVIQTPHPFNIQFDPSLTQILGKMVKKWEIVVEKWWVGGWWENGRFL